MHEHHMRTLARDRAEAWRAEAAEHLLVRQAQEEQPDSERASEPTRSVRRKLALVSVLRSGFAAMRRRMAIR